MMKRTNLIVIFYLMNYPLLWAGNFEEQHVIIETAEQFARESLGMANKDTNTAWEITISPLDSRIKLHKCTSPLLAFWPPGSQQLGNTSIGIQCMADKSWKLYLNAKIKQFNTVVTAKSFIARDSRITEAQLSYTKRDISSERQGYFTTHDLVIGKRSKRDINYGQLITAYDIEAAKVIKRGSEIRIMAADPQFSISMKGKALADGAVNDWIKVKNLSSSRVIEAKVIDEKTVQVMTR